MAKNKTVEENDLRYPAISDRELAERYSKIKPVFRGNDISQKETENFLINRWAKEKNPSGGKLAELIENADNTLFWVKGVDPKNVSFIWNPTPIGVATGLKEIGRIQTYHRFGYAGFFKPTISEVLAQIPAELVGHTVAFEIVKPYGVPIGEVLTADGKYQHAETILYGRSSLAGLLKDVKRQILPGESTDWDPQKEAAERKAEVKLLRKRAHEAAKGIFANLAEAKTNDAGHVYEWTSFVDYFETLFDVEENMPSTSGKYDTVENVLKTVGDLLEKGNLPFGKAQVLLEELNRAARSKQISLPEPDGWGEEARRIAVEFLARVHQQVLSGGTSADAALDIAWSAKPFLLNDVSDQIFWTKAMEPIYNAITDSYNFEKENSDKLLALLRRKPAKA